MLADGLVLTEGTAIKNCTIDSGPSFPAQGNLAELFYKTDNVDLQGPIGVYVHNGTNWVQIPTGVGSQGGQVSPLDRPTHVVYGYDAEDRVQTITSTIAGQALVETIAYDANDMVGSITSTYLGATIIETYAYNAAGFIAEITLTAG